MQTVERVFKASIDLYLVKHVQKQMSFYDNSKPLINF